MTSRIPLGAGAALAALLIAEPLARADEKPVAASTAAVDALREQMDEDITPIPAGMGALLVPSLTRSDQEPLVVVQHAGRRIASGPTGRRIVLPPASYEVLLGTGDLADRPRRIVEVTEGVTTPVTPFFGALRVDVVDASGVPVTRDYVVASNDGKRVIGPIGVVGGKEYKAGDTLILHPGEYVVALGRSADRKTDRFAISVAPGQVMRYRLVVDDARLMRTELASGDLKYEPSIWRFRWIIGGNGSFGYRQQALSGFEGASTVAEALTRLEAGIDTGNNLALLTLKANQSLIGLNSRSGVDQPLQSLVNEASLELLYNYRISRVFGPYIRGIGWTSFLPTVFYPRVPSTVRVVDEDGNVTGIETVEQGGSVETFEAFAPSILQEGAGLGVTPVDNRYVTFFLRGGASARQWFYRGSRLITSVDGSEISALELRDLQRFGIEATAGFGLRLGSTLQYETTLDGFMPFEQLSGDEKIRPSFRWDNTVALTLSDVVALVYQGRIGLDHPKVPQIQISQLVALRLQYAIF
jgi:hypothetical protein